MLLILKLAFRNVFRNFRRSLLTFLSIAIGIGLSIMIVGFSIGFEKQALLLSVATKTGHIKLYSKGYINDKLTLPLDYTIVDYAVIITEIHEEKGVLSAAGRILFPGTLTDGRDELRLTGAGIHAAREDVTFHLSDHIIDGNYIKNGEEKILLGDEVAGLFNIGTGDVLTIIARTKYGSITALDVEIAGIFHVNNPEIDNNYFFLPLDVAQTMLDMNNEVTEITLFGHSMQEADALVAAIDERLDNNAYDIVTWEYLLRDLLRLFRIRAKSRQILYAILFILAAASIMNTMLMSVYERTREIGTLMALGFRWRKVLWLFSFEGVYLGVLGSTFGCIAGGWFTYYFKINGLNLDFFGGSSGIQNMPLAPVLYPEINPVMLSYFFMIGILVALLSAAYPSWKGARMEPTDALRAV